MPIFGRSGGSSGGSSFFQKVKSGVGSVFGGINRAAGAVGRLAGRAGDVLGTISSIAKNPIVGVVAGALGQGENLSRFADATGKGAGVAQRVGAISNKVQAISSPATYAGQNPVAAARNAIERAKDVKASAMNIRVMGGDPATFTPLPRNFA